MEIENQKQLDLQKIKDGQISEQEKNKILKKVAEEDKQKLEKTVSDLQKAHLIKQNLLN